MQTILAAIDGSKHAHRALDLAIEIAAKMDAELLVLYVAEPRSVTPDEVELAQVEYGDELQRYASWASAEVPQSFDRNRLGAFVEGRAKAGSMLLEVIGKGLLERAAADAKAHGVGRVETRLVDGNPVEGIVETAKANKVDLIVMGRHGFGAIGGLLQGSVSQKVNHLADCSVLTVK